MTETTTKPRDVQVAQLGPETLVLRSRTWDRLKFEVEYARQKGTTANSYLIQADKLAIIDPPGGSFSDIYLQELAQQVELSKLDYVILGHCNPNRLETLKALLKLAPQVTLVCSKAGALILQAGFEGEDVKISVVRGDETLNLGQGHELQFISVPTPRWPDELFTYDPASRILYTDKLFGAHICDDPVLDENWKQLDEDRHYYFDCLHASQSRQVEIAMDRFAAYSAKYYAPAHGPIVRYSLSRLNLDYRDWCDAQKVQDLSVAVLYASAYGNTTAMAQAIAAGITKAGVKAEAINCEFHDPTEIQAAIETCDGFVIGSPTLGGHMPTQMQTALGIVLSTAAKTKVAGVFGSYGWSGEAIDEIEGKLQDAGFPLGFNTLRVKFSPTEATLQDCTTAGTELAQFLKKTKKQRLPQQSLLDTQSDRTEQAVGRIVGSLCVLTAQSKNANNFGGLDSGPLALLVAWVSQSSFTPPGLTVAIAKDRAEGLDHSGDQFVLNILKEGMNLRRQFAKPFAPGEDRFKNLSISTAENGCPILNDALAYLECTVESRMEAGDHWLIYATINNGKMLQATGMTAVQHRKSGNQY
jgi:flavorubredoxin/flavin reductase (DIM6/NTAB) family NADH-FMN oxidoreductase RutF